MSKASRTYERLLSVSSRPISFREFERCVLGFGFVHRRSRGSHRSYHHPRVKEVLTLQPRGKDAQPYQVRLFLAMVAKYKLEPGD
ncbi:MAG: type II toxin-antitoxin system HicA family toxin [Alphaproteobacteria bacterium]|nr:type II toxin-antitoxin system HicA family toxin [Alphaproteobacteria bacterium]MBV9370042.1 type II toxin-antitoxin system HicA family toxin [Alphaproteobacteria bacterium]MBV9900716.1 type II toxin-antitoxin system HicA family toxin [Alphaproteobacteria bacterium]